MNHDPRTVPASPYDRIFVFPRVSRPSAFSKELAGLLKQIVSDDQVFMPGLSHFYHQYRLAPYLANDGVMHFVASVVFIDLALAASDILREITSARNSLLNPVFILCSTPGEELALQAALPPEEAEQFVHYYRLPKDGLSAEAVLDVFQEACLTAIRKRDQRRDESLRLFISYSRKNLAFAFDLARKLKQHGYPVWFDKAELAGGDDWLREIERALAGSDILLLIASPDALASQYVTLEYTTFAGAGKPVIPVLIEPVTDMPREISALQYIDLTNVPDRQRQLELILQAIRRQKQRIENGR
jgi:hypothetical protein